MKNYYTSKYFYGHEISEYGLENGYMDYRTLASAFDMVLNNDIILNTLDIGYWDIVNGCDYDEKNDEYTDIFQYYIISDNGYNILSEMTDEIVFYNEKLDMYVWGITHYGTSWDYVLTDIKLDLEKGDC